MPDPHLRGLDLRVQQGDSAAQIALQAEQHRRGELKLSYVLVPQTGFARTYAEGIHWLRDACAQESFSPQPEGLVDGQARFIPLSFEETVRACVDDYDAKVSAGLPREESLFYSRPPLHSRSGIAYKGGTTLFKIVRECQPLFELERDFDCLYGYLPCDYDALDGVQLDSKTAKYNKPLTIREMVFHPAWGHAIPNKDLRERFINFAYSQLCAPRGRLRIGEGMGFHVLDRPEDSQLRPLTLSDAFTSNAYGNHLLDDSARFLRVVPRSP